MFARFTAAVALLALSPAPLERTAVQPARPSAVPTDAAARSPRIANYRIEARLDVSTRTITGNQLVTWRNATANATSTLHFHLYFNAWRNTSSTWMRENRLAAANSLDSRPEGDWSWIDVGMVGIQRSAGETTLISARRFISPDDGNPDDRTVLELALDRPVAPGETVSIRMEWTARVPRTFARTGTIGNYYFIAQWFPKIGVLHDSGWNCHQFHSATEFFSDFGIYDVSLTVPRGWVVGATGVERERHEQEDGTTTHRYYQEDVHDFAWTTSPDYLEFIDTFSHPSLPDVRLRLLLQPEHRGQRDRHFAASRAALRYYGEWYGPYPYGHLTIVDPAWQSGAGGMEYPTLFTAGTRWIAPRRATQPESVTIHEAGHQFWYGIVATNEFEHAWLDEGFNTFSTLRVIEEEFEPNYLVRRYFGGFVPWIFRDLPITRMNRSLAAYRSQAAGDVQALPTWRYWPGTASSTTYHKTALWLHTMERMLGWEMLQRILTTYFTRGAFRHPSPQDFFAVANEVSGQDLTWFFDQVHRSSHVFDYGIDLLRSESGEPRGYIGEGGSRTFRDGESSALSYRTTVVVRRFGEGTFPVDVKVSFENGEEARWRWDGRDRWKLFGIDKASRARRADVDPDRVLMLDVNLTNNSAVLDTAAAKAGLKWSLAWLIWLQDHLLTYGFFI